MGDNRIDLIGHDMNDLNTSMKLRIKSVGEKVGELEKCHSEEINELKDHIKADQDDMHKLLGELHVDMDKKLDSCLDVMNQGMSSVQNKLEADILTMNEKMIAANDELVKNINEQHQGQDLILQELNEKVEKGMKCLEEELEEAQNAMKTEIIQVQQAASSEK